MLLDAVATYLESTSTMLNRNNLTRGFMPDNPDTVTTLFETGGIFPLHYFTTGSQTRAYERPSLMIHSRSTDQQTARAFAEDVVTILDGVHDRGLPTTTGTHYLSIGAVQSPFLVGRDSNDRYIFSVNFDVTKTTG